jgi:hypothetical protein
MALEFEALSILTNSAGSDVNGFLGRLTGLILGRSRAGWSGTLAVTSPKARFWPQAALAC